MIKIILFIKYDISSKISYRNITAKSVKLSTQILNIANMFNAILILMSKSGDLDDFLAGTSSRNAPGNIGGGGGGCDG